MTTRAPVRPMNQKLRILLLRLLFLAILPPLFLIRSPFQDMAFGEILETLGLLATVAAVLGRFWATLYIGGHKNGQVMMDGPYSMCRHPLYVASSLGILGLGLMSQSVILTFVITAPAVAILIATARREEAFLRAEFGAAHAAYTARVPLFLPQPGLFRTAPMISVSTAHLRTNLLDAAVFLSFYPLMELVEVLHERQILPTIFLW
jgi:protein-S-isoprenylcysteine O-methyltransferase Ste14